MSIHEVNIMKQSQITDLAHLLPGNYENIFNVYTNEDNMYYYNLLETVLLPTLPQACFSIYTIQPKDTWPLISYKVYGTTILWWLILQVNNISNPTVMPSPGTLINTLNTDYISTITTAIDQTT